MQRTMTTYQATPADHPSPAGGRGEGVREFANSVPLPGVADRVTSLIEFAANDAAPNKPNQIATSLTPRPSPARGRGEHSIAASTSLFPINGREG